MFIKLVSIEDQVVTCMFSIDDQVVLLSQFS